MDYDFNFVFINKRLLIIIVFTKITRMSSLADGGICEIAIHILIEGGLKGEWPFTKSIGVGIFG